MSNKESLNALKDAKEELEAAREAARLKLHLLSMDARRTWDDLEVKVHELQEKLVHELQEKLGDRGEMAAEVSAVAARDLARSIRKFVEKHI